jgi:imidazolonepropionase-like amidohydrolase
MLTAIVDARVFDGERVIDAPTVVIDGAGIEAVGGPVPPGATIVDAAGGTLMPGLIDSHTHTSLDNLGLALRFGVTTELEMMGHWTPAERQAINERDNVADVRSAGMAITPPGGHPSEYGPPDEGTSRGHMPRGRDGDDDLPGDFAIPFCSTPEETVKMIERQVAEGYDYIKIMIEDGTVLGCPGLPMISNEVLTTAVKEAHRHGKLAIAHITTADGARRAVAAGVDGLGHVFIDGPHTPELIAAIAGSGAFVIPTLTVVASAMGHAGAGFAADDRVRGKLGREWLEALAGSMNVYPQGNLDNAFGAVVALHAAGVDILAGTDVSEPRPGFGGMAHGASLHHELQLLVTAGLTPVQALRAATSTPAHRFGLTDRGRITRGARADLLLVDGDPATTISDSLSIRAVWRRGVHQAPVA